MYHGQEDLLKNICLIASQQYPGARTTHMQDSTFKRLDFVQIRAWINKNVIPHPMIHVSAKEYMYVGLNDAMIDIQ